MRTLLPFQINVLYLPKPEQVVGQDIRFENIPWMNTEKDVFENPNIPLETNSIIPRPFSYDNAIYLKEGVHLHFVLPTYFKKFGEQGDLPLAPNRWYIKNEHSGKEWIIESDYIWNINDPELDKHATCTFVEGVAGEDFNFYYVGRKYTLDQWNSKEHSSYLKQLTALGWGSMSFDVHYPNCRSVFGFHDEEGKQGDIYTIVGWIHENSSLPIVAGKFKLISNDTEEVVDKKKKVEFNIAIANTLPETLTALIVEDFNSSENLTDKLKLEEQIESLLNFDALNDQKLDCVPRLRHSLHEKQFNRTEGFIEWSLDLSGMPSILEAKVLEILKEKYLKERLSNLNKKQSELDHRKQKFYSELEHLYNQWSNYQNVLFVERTSSKELAKNLSWIQNKVAFLNLTDCQLNNQKIEIDKLSTQLLYLSKSKVKESEILNIVSEYNKGKSTDNQIKISLSDILNKITIVKKSTLDFYEALAPTVIISAPKDNVFTNTEKIFKDGEYCIFNTDFSSNDIKEIINRIDWLTETKCNQWNSYKVEWHANFLPKKNGYYLNQANKQFKENFIEDTYILDEQNADLIKDFNLDGITYNSSSDNYYGHSFIDSKIKDYVLNKINLFNENSFDLEKQNPELHRLLDKYQSKLENINLFSFTLSDFNHLMIQRSAELSIMPLIPNGFENHQTIAKDLHSLLSRNKSNVNLLTTNKLATFNPLRNGAFTINRLRIVDSFGREKLIQPKKIISTKNQTFVDKDNWVILPPRILQESTLKLSFDHVVSNNQESPVIGWIVVSYLNQYLEFYDTNGNHLGAITSEGNWEPSPFDVVLASKNEEAYKAIGNNNLVSIIAWFLEKAKKDKDKFLSQVIQEIQNNLEHIKPEDYHNPSLMETISSVPMAITKIDYQFLSKGNLIDDVNYSFSESTNDNGLNKIKFPVRFGDINQYNDGLIGYWNIKNEKEIQNLGHLYINSETVLKLSNVLNEGIELTKSVDYFVEKIKYLDLSTRMSTLNDKGFDYHLTIILDEIEKTESKMLNAKGKELLRELVSEINKFKALGFPKIREIKNLKETINKLSNLEQYLNPDILFLEKRIQDLSINRNFNFNIDLSNIKSILDDIIENKGFISKSIIIKYFIEKGNMIWDLLKELNIVNIDDLNKTLLPKTKDKHLHSRMNGNLRSIVVLMHPKAKLFVKTGILPEQNIQIPYNAIKNALRKIELTLLTAPVLTPKNDLQISLLRDKRYRWSWVDLEKKTKKQPLSIDNPPIKNRFTQDIALQNLSEQNLKILIDRTLIDELPFYTEESIHFINEDAWQELLNKEMPTADELTIIDLVNQHKMSISDFNISNAQIPKLVLKEGWLSIKSKQL